MHPTFPQEKTFHRYPLEQHDSRWVDGLRGLAACLVATFHVSLCLAPGLGTPCCGSDGITPLLFQRPFLRLISSGHAWVALFFLLSGYVAALKPLSLARAGKLEGALTALASSARRRTLRLVLPAALVTVLSWGLCQLGAFETGRQSDAWWLYTNSPVPSRSWYGAVGDLWKELRYTWIPGMGNLYDQPQWTMVWLWSGSMVGYLALLVTLPLSSAWRAGVLAAGAWCSIGWVTWGNDPLVGLTTLGGIFLASMTLTPLPLPLRLTSIQHRSPIPITLLLTLPVSLFLMSYPPSLPETASWSAALTDLLPHLPETPEPFRLLPSIGAFLLVSGVITSPGAKRALATPAAARLGRASFAIYLLHGMVLRSVFAWVLFWGAELEDVDIEDPTGRRDWVVASRYAVPGAGRCVVAVAVAVLVLAGAVLVWVRWVERWCGAVAGMVEGWMADGGEGIRKDAAF